MGSHKIRFFWLLSSTNSPSRHMHHTCTQRGRGTVPATCPHSFPGPDPSTSVWEFVWAAEDLERWRDFFSYLFLCHLSFLVEQVSREREESHRTLQRKQTRLLKETTRGKRGWLAHTAACSPSLWNSQEQRRVTGTPVSTTSSEHLPFWETDKSLPRSPHAPRPDQTKLPFSGAGKMRKTEVKTELAFTLSLFQ